jgi:hypothetical protein
MTVILVALLCTNGIYASITPVSPNPGGEPNLYAGLSGNPKGNVMDTLYGVGNYSRIDDALDQTWWKWNGGATVEAKYASDSSVLYWRPIGSATATFLFNIGVQSPKVTATLSPKGVVQFTWELKDTSTNNTLFSSVTASNPDTPNPVDHMVTFLITGGADRGNIVGNYVIAWEDRSVPGSDLDYQDAVIEVTEAAPIPEASTFIVWSLLGALGVTVGWHRRRKAA